MIFGYLWTLYVYVCRINDPKHIYNKYLILLIKSDMTNKYLYIYIYIYLYYLIIIFCPLFITSYFASLNAPPRARGMGAAAGRCLACTPPLQTQPRLALSSSTTSKLPLRRSPVLAPSPPCVPSPPFPPSLSSHLDPGQWRPHLNSSGTPTARRGRTNPNYWLLQWLMSSRWGNLCASSPCCLCLVSASSFVWNSSLNHKL
jgi:hypothetical protein